MIAAILACLLPLADVDIVSTPDTRTVTVEWNPRPPLIDLDGDGIMDGFIHLLPGGGGVVLVLF